MPKKIAIIGASRGVGLKTVERALERGHQVVALSRSTGTLPKHANLVTIKGSATNLEDCKRAITDADSVIVTLGTGMSVRGTTLFSDAAKMLIQAQTESRRKVPLIVLTGFGAGNSAQYQSFFVRNMMKLVMGAIYKNKTEMEKMIAKSGIPFEFVRPGILVNTPRTERYQIITEYKKGRRVSRISRSDVADYLVKEVENPANLGKYPALTY